MNRRNFLKLFGLLAAPATAVAQLVKPKDIVHTGEIQLKFRHYDSHQTYVNGEIADICRIGCRPGVGKVIYRTHLGGSFHPMIVNSTDVITVRGVHCDVEVSFMPQWNASKERFETVLINTYFENERDPNYQDIRFLEAVIIEEYENT